MNQLLIIGPPVGCNFTGSFTAPGGDGIESVDKMKLVGFTFGDEPGVGAHVEAICDKYKHKKWMLHHLREAGFRDMTLYRLYCCYIRSIFEYCSPVFHSLLTAGQEAQLERLQRHALRTCFGCSGPIEHIIDSNQIDSLKIRRERRVDAFIRKAAVNPRFGPLWFPPREGLARTLRNRREIQETRAASQRRFNSPLLHMRRRANVLGVLPPRGPE